MSSLAGVVRIGCSLEDDDLLLTWKEHGGPSLNGAPDTEGFGTVLARRIVTQQFGGRLSNGWSNDWEAEGLLVHISMPVERLNSWGAPPPGWATGWPALWPERVHIGDETIRLARRFALYGRPWKLGAGILIVEDELLIRMDTASVIEDAGFAVYEADSADEAIRILEKHRDIRLIFTDVHMPGSMDGLKLAHYVRGRWPPIKIIVTSGQVRVREEDMPRGGVFLGKPYRPEHLTSKLREMVGQVA